MIKKIFGYLALLLLTVFIADRVLYYVLDKMSSKAVSGDSGGKINDYLRQQPTPTLAIMGPSTVTYQMNPIYFSVNTYNLGRANSEDAFQTALLSVIVQYGKKPKNILLEIDPYDYLGDDSAANYVSKSPLDLEFYYSKNELTTTYINEIGLTERVKFLMHLMRYNNYLISVVKNYITRKPLPFGYLSLEVSNKDSINVTKEYKQQKQGITLQQTNATVIQKLKMRYLSTFISICKQQKIHLILFTLPNYNDVLEGYKSDVATRNINKYCTDNEVQYFDFRKGSLCSLINKASYWKDLLHMNEYGSIIESKFISKEIAPFLAK